LGLRVYFHITHNYAFEFLLLILNTNMDLLLPLELPPYPFKISDVNGQLTLFDEIRKKHIIITPEEWVRQHFVQYLINQKKYPKTLVKLEGGLRLNGMAKRSDIVVFNPAGEKILMVECKAPSVAINQKVFDQIARYNMTHKVSLLAVTNGLQHYYCSIDFKNQAYKFIEELPAYNEL
jgi:hypothetical protein